MKREDLLAKGYSQEQVTDLLNMFHETNQANVNLQSQIDGLKQFETKYNEAQKQLDDINKANMTVQEQIEAERKETARKLAEANKIYNTAKAKTILAGYDIEDDLISKIVSDDENVTVASANMLKAKLDSYAEASSKKKMEELSKLNVKPTPTNVSQNDDIMTKEKFQSMTMSGQKAWKDAHIEEYRQMFPQS